MLRDELVVGQEYAFRLKPNPKLPLERVKLSGKAGGRLKVLFVDEDPPQTEYVRSSQLVSAWKTRGGFLQREAAQAALREQVTRDGYKRNSPLDTAATSVLESTGEAIFIYLGVLQCQPDALERICNRAAVPQSRYQLQPSYQKANGEWQISFGLALDLARAFCREEPLTVLQSVQATEREWSDRVEREDDKTTGELLNEYRSAWALVHQWTGPEAATANRDRQIEKLRRLVWDAVYALQVAGLDKEAERLRRALAKGA